MTRVGPGGGAGGDVRLLGARFGGYQVLREVARGAVARVYLASDGRDALAVKAFPASEGDRADREARVGRGLDHPNLVPVLARLDLGGHPAVTMPFVPGRRLGTWLATADRTARLDVADGLLAGLGRLHAAGVVHRDVKPENVLVTRDGRPVLIDYDLATDPNDADGRRTAAGTVAYLSPEQARGEPAEPASDLYALGVLLYWMLCGEVPFAGSVAEVMEGHRTSRARAPSALDAALVPFDPVVGRLLAKRPGERFADADAARAALAAVRAGG